METAGFELQVPAFATRLKGEVTSAPFAGVVTVMACAGTIIVASAKIEQRKPLMDQPRKEMGERAFPLTVAAACATAAKSMLTMAVIAQRTVRANSRGVFSPIGIRLAGLKRSAGEEFVD
jgi:predicted component of type VI protein secretion system